MDIPVVGLSPYDDDVDRARERRWVDVLVVLVGCSDSTTKVVHLSTLESGSEMGQFASQDKLRASVGQNVESANKITYQCG